MKSPVLLYHKIDLPTPDVRIRGAFTSPHAFARQLKYLKGCGYTFYTASEMVQHLKDHGGFPERGVCLTFDDGWKDNYLHAFPVIKDLGAKATIFLVPECIGQVTDVVTAEGEGPREHLAADDIREMSAAGIEFGSHSMSHLLFDRAAPADIENEVRGSKRFIEDMLQTECNVFAYPAGFFTDFAKEAVGKAGFAAAFSTVYGPADGSDPFALNRTEILRRHSRPFRFGSQIRSIFR